MSERKSLLLLCLIIAVGASATVATSEVLFAAGRTLAAAMTTSVISRN